ncbi:MAG TPA: response regulator [Thermoanaerobaculia bacterium]|nr:response regulator [Thermoanaerobaculia bacterium]
MLALVVGEMTNGQRILVVDDDDAIRALVQTVLRRRGFHVDGARNGIDALERLAAARYALIILDLMMPSMNGHELLDALSRESVMTRPRVLILSVGLEPRTFDSDLVIGTVHKPFDIELLLDIVTGYLSTNEPATTTN